MKENKYGSGSIRKPQSPPLGDGGKLYVIKIGGKIIDDQVALSSVLKNFSSIKNNKILIHGGGSIATKLASQLGITQNLIKGRRITDAETLKVVTMVYAGYINKNIVAQLQGFGCNAIGLTGTDGNLIIAHKRTIDSSSGDDIDDYGYAGDIDEVNTDLLKNFVEQKLTPVIAPITHDKNGQLLNTNADTIAQEVATRLTNEYEVHLIYCFEKPGVLKNPEDETSLIKQVTRTYYETLKEKKIVSNGMVPKLDNAFTALNVGVKEVVIGRAENLNNLISGTSGTSIVNE